MSKKFTACALMYGDYPLLADRCLSSLAKLPPAVEIRLGLNDVCEETLAIVQDFISTRPSTIVIANAENKHKYPVMRQLFYDKPLTTEFVMWFDDDSWITAADVPAWLAGVEQQMRSADVLGSLYRMHLVGDQHKWVSRQSWYGGKTGSTPRSVLFATGGWWVARVSSLQSVNWPVPELDHRGGDVMLGELIRQQDWRLSQLQFGGVAINADDDGRESQSPRRGFDSAPIGFRI
jgi:hypothetical protein